MKPQPQVYVPPGAGPRRPLRDGPSDPAKRHGAVFAGWVFTHVATVVVLGAGFLALIPRTGNEGVSLLKFGGGALALAMGLFFVFVWLGSTLTGVFTGRPFAAMIFFFLAPAELGLAMMLSAHLQGARESVELATAERDESILATGSLQREASPPVDMDVGERMKTPAGLEVMGIRKSQKFEEWVIHDGFLTNAGVERMKLDPVYKGSRFALGVQSQPGGWSATSLKVQGREGLQHFIRGPKDFAPEAKLRYTLTSVIGGSGQPVNMPVTVSPDGTLPIFVDGDTCRVEVGGEDVTFNAEHGFRMRELLKKIVH